MSSHDNWKTQTPQDDEDDQARRINREVDDCCISLGFPERPAPQKRDARGWFEGDWDAPS